MHIRTDTIIENFLVKAGSSVHPLQEKLSFNDIQQASFYSGNSNQHLDFFYSGRKSAMGHDNKKGKRILASDNLLVKLLECYFSIDDGSILFRFLTEATPYDEPKYELKDNVSNYNAGRGNSSHGYGYLKSNPSKLYTMELLIRDFYDVLESLTLPNDIFTKDDLSTILSLTEDVALACTCPGALLIGSIYYLTQEGASIRPCNIAPKRWNRLRPNVCVCKHLENLLKEQTISFLLPQMAQMAKKELIKAGLLTHKK